MSGADQVGISGILTGNIADSILTTITDGVHTPIKNQPPRTTAFCILRGRIAGYRYTGAVLMQIIR